MTGIRYYPPMLLNADWMGLVAYLGGPDSNAQINTARILLNTGYPNFSLNSWESPTAGKINGAKLDAVAASLLAGQIIKYTDAQITTDPTGTTSTTGVMMGIGSTATYTPTRSGILLVQVNGQMQNNTANSGAVAKLYYGTGSAPANQAAIIGTQAGKPSQIDSFPTAAKRFPFSIATVIPGLTLNTAYWVDLSLAAIVGNTASLNNLEVVITEL